MQRSMLAAGALVLIGAVAIGLILHQRQTAQDAESARWAAQGEREARHSRVTECLSGAMRGPLDTPADVARMAAAAERCERR